MAIVKTLKGCHRDVNSGGSCADGDRTPEVYLLKIWSFSPFSTCRSLSFTAA